MKRALVAILASMLVLTAPAFTPSSAEASPQPVNQTRVIKTALDLPTWDDVQEAKKNSQSAAAKVTEIEGLLVQVQAQVEEARARSEEASNRADEANIALMKAANEADQLLAHARESEQQAVEAANQAAALVSQIYRSAGVDRNLELFLESDATTADTLLDRLAMMEKATERNTAISEEAQYAMNNAKSLGEQADAAEAERQRLFTIAEEESQRAGEVLEQARQELVNAEAQEVELNAQLEALLDEESKTVDGYKERVRIEEEERKERERQAAEAARKAAEEEARRQQEWQQQQNQGGGGSSSSAPSVSYSGWVRPLNPGSYYISTEWWGYYGHYGIDMATGAWNPIYAAASGTVIVSGWWGGCGNTVRISHGDVVTSYCHMVQSPHVYYGQWVNAGQIIGYVGTTGNSTGNHLHFETMVNGVYTNPRPFMDARGIWL